MKIIWCMVPEIWSTRDINFCQFGHFFCSFTPLLTEKIKILKKLKNTGDIIILHVYHKWQSYDVWYLRYGMRRTNFFDSWGGILCSFTSLATRKIKILKKWKKKRMEISSFYTSVSKIMIISMLFLRYGMWRM